MFKRDNFFYYSEPDATQRRQIVDLTRCTKHVAKDVWNSGIYPNLNRPPLDKKALKPPPSPPKCSSFLLKALERANSSDSQSLRSFQFNSGNSQKFDQNFSFFSTQSSAESSHSKYSNKPLNFYGESSKNSRNFSSNSYEYQRQNSLSNGNSNWMNQQAKNLKYQKENVDKYTLYSWRSKPQSYEEEKSTKTKNVDRNSGGSLSGCSSTFKDTAWTEKFEWNKQKWEFREDGKKKKKNKSWFFKNE